MDVCSYSLTVSSARYVMVRYKFDTDVDDTRKEAFRAAAADWRTHTCIAVVEDDNAEAWSSLVMSQ